MLHDSHLLNVEYINELKKIIDFDRKFPEYVFKNRKYQFWFFERELILFQDLMKDFIGINNSNFKSKAIIFFGHPDLEKFLYYSFDGAIVTDLEQLSIIFEKKFLESSASPITFTNENFDWLYFESFNEEIGVIAVKGKNLNKTPFIDFLNHALLSSDKIDLLYACGHGKLADLIKRNYL